MNRLLLISSLLCLASTVSFAEPAQDVVTVEIFVDSDPGFGNGNVFSGIEGDNSYTLPTKEITPGAHLISVRAKDSDGLWSATVTNPLYVADDVIVAGAEYFIDQDPGHGKATAIANCSGKVFSFNVSTTNIPVGSHTLGVRVKGADGQWTDVMTRAFLVTKPGFNGGIIEYFIDQDPGIGNGTQVEATDEETVIFIPTRSLSAGAHLISVRTRDGKGQWSATVVNPLYVVEPIGLSRAEYYVDNDPGQGNGTTVSIQTDGDASFVVPTQGLSAGMHQLVFRGQLVNGQYVSLFEAPFNVTKENDATGITDIEWAMDANIVCTDGIIRVSGESLADGCTVEVFDLNGIKLVSDTSSPDSRELTFDINRKQGPFIVAVTSKAGLRYVKLVI